jgi:hypothetical protein
MSTFADIAAALAGAATFCRRVQAAARRVRRGDDGTREMQRVAYQLCCIEDAVARAVRKINIDSMTARPDP